MDKKQSVTGLSSTASEQSMREYHQTGEVPMPTKPLLIENELFCATAEAHSQVPVFHKYPNLPLELKTEVLSHLLVAPNPIVNMIAPTKIRRLRDGENADNYSTKPRSTLFRRRPCFAAGAYRNYTTVIESILSPSVLRANKECYNTGLYLLYGVNTYSIVHLGALGLFARKYPEAAGRMQKVLFEAELEQAGAFYGRILKNPGPHLSRCLGQPELFSSFAMTEKMEDRLSSRYASLKSLTIDFKNWEQKQEFDRHAQVGEKEEGVQVGGSEMEAPTPFALHIASVINASSVAMTDSKTIVPRYQERIAQPVSVVWGADLRAWIKGLVDGGWQAVTPRITGLETLADQGLVAELMELLEKKGGRKE